MRFGDVLKALPEPPVATSGDLSVAVSGATHDSRSVEPGDIFIALRGARFDGHDFLGEALSRGAAAAVVEGLEGLTRVPDGLPAAAVESGRRAMPHLAAEVYRHPSRELDVLGVTGTNGKSSTCYYLDSIARARGLPSGLFTTLEVRLPGGDSLVASRTTPEATDLQRWLRSMANAGAREIAMEVSSHALDQHRVASMCFAGAVFTNLTQDHLDWHQTMESYFLAKARLFATEVHNRGDCVGAVNIDDPYGLRLVALAECRVVTYGATHPSADIRAEGITLSPEGTSLTLRTPDGAATVRLQLRGRFAAYNALAAAALSWGRGVSLDAIVSGLEALAAVPGRLELVRTEQGPAVYVDYAHTPDSLESVLASVREFCKGRLICVFGCGGDRDATKRPLMASAVARAADVAIVTSDNPRSEDAESIIDMVVPGFGTAHYLRIADRREAIRHAIALAEPSDIVLIAGKGHETYQEFAGGRRVHFDDREVAREALQDLDR